MEVESGRIESWSTPSRSTKRLRPSVSSPELASGHKQTIDRGKSGQILQSLPRALKLEIEVTKYCDPNAKKVGKVAAEYFMNKVNSLVGILKQVTDDFLNLENDFYAFKTTETRIVSIERTVVDIQKQLRDLSNIFAPKSTYADIVAKEPSVSGGEISGLLTEVVKRGAKRGFRKRMVVVEAP